MTLRSHPHAPPGGRRIPVAVLGATGAVGQNFIRLLVEHPWFELVELAASERSAGRPYGEAARWIGSRMPAGVGDRTVLGCDPAQVSAPIVFSALDASVAGEVEAAFARAGRTVLSNAKNYRMEPDVPLLVPEVNADHVALLETQRKSRGWKGAIVTNPNCAAATAVMALAPLHERWGVKRVFAATMQAVSGAGYPGVPSLDILGNVIPFINEEEPKIERELPKMLGKMNGGGVELADVRVSAHANRVAVENGHTVCMSIELGQRVSPGEAQEAIACWRGAEAVRGLPTAPEPPVRIAEQPDRPQPRRDVESGGGMQAVVGRVRPDPLLDLRLVVLGHNTIRGAAGCSVLNAELLARRGLLNLA